MDPSLEYLQPDEARPAKRQRMDAPLTMTEHVQEEFQDDVGTKEDVEDLADWDDIYENPTQTPKADPVDGAVAIEHETVSQSEATLTDEATSVAQTHHEPYSPSSTFHDSTHTTPITHASHAEGGAQAPSSTLPTDQLPAEAIDRGEELVDESRNVTAAEEASERMVEEMTDVNADSQQQVDAAGGQVAENALLPEVATGSTTDDRVHSNGDAVTNSTGMLEQDTGTGAGEGNEVVVAPAVKATDDVAFMAAAAAQNGKADAEWRFDPSDAESSSDSDSTSDDSSSGSDSDSDGGYELLDAATAAKILMSADGDDDDDAKNKGKGGDRQPRTANEVKEAVIPKPDVVVTEDTHIVELGTVAGTVENMVLIKGFTPGEYQVLETGSVLCTADRKVIGAVADTIGKVQEPMYSVAFNNADEITDAGLTFGTKLYYVVEHSTFVFTQPLKNLKGTDASNIHDEEVGADEVEFSDDEAEAEYKRQKKMAKKAARGGMQVARGGGSRRSSVTGEPGFIHGSDNPHQSYGAGMSYDDEPADEFYKPLRRPDNLSEMMATGGPPRPPQHGGFDRGRGGRGRGDRGRGRGDRGRGDRGRGRGGFHQERPQRGGGRGSFPQSAGHRGNAQSFPDRHNNERPSSQGQQHYLPPKPAVPQTYQAAPQQQYPAQAQHYPQQPAAHQPYQFNGQTYQYGTSAPAPAQQPQSFYGRYAAPAIAQSSAPTSSYTNPAYYQAAAAQQPAAAAYQPQAQATQQQSADYARAYAAWYQQQAQQARPQPQQAAQPYTQPGAGPQPSNTNLADILRQYQPQ